MALSEDLSSLASAAPAYDPSTLGHHATPAAGRTNILDPGFNLSLIHI